MSAFNVGGITLLYKARVVLMIPAAPAAAFVCPIMDLTDPIAVLFWVAVLSRVAVLAVVAVESGWSKNAFNAVNSTLSPTRVPVPWASINSTVEG